MFNVFSSSRRFFIVEVDRAQKFPVSDILAQIRSRLSSSGFENSFFEPLSSFLQSLNISTTSMYAKSLFELSKIQALVFGVLALLSTRPSFSGTCRAHEPQPKAPQALLYDTLVLSCLHPVLLCLNPKRIEANGIIPMACY